MGVVGWLRRPPTTKQRKNGDAVLLLDLEDEHSTSVRIICLGAVRERYITASCELLSVQARLPCFNEEGSNMLIRGLCITACCELAVAS